MNCPFCNKSIEAMTGFQEIVKFQKHLVKCKKNPERKILPSFINEDGILEKEVNITSFTTLNEALKIRDNSGQ